MRCRCLVLCWTAFSLGLATSANAATPVLFLDRCAGGCTYTTGFDDSRTNDSIIVNDSSTLSAFAHGDPSFEAVLACVRDSFAPFAIDVTDVDPGQAEHFEIAVAGTAQQLGQSAGVTSVAPVTCENGGVVANGVAFAFANTIGDTPLEICANTAQVAGTLLGLDHEMLAGDVMTYLDGPLPKAFLDADAACGEFEARPCACGGTTQNSYQRLLATLPEPGAGAGALVAVAALGFLRRCRPV